MRMSCFTSTDRSSGTALSVITVDAIPGGRDRRTGKTLGPPKGWRRNRLSVDRGRGWRTRPVFEPVDGLDLDSIHTTLSGRSQRRRCLPNRKGRTATLRWRIPLPAFATVNAFEGCAVSECQVSYHCMPDALPHNLKEREADLIGAAFLHCNRPPFFQYSPLLSAPGICPMLLSNRHSCFALAYDRVSHFADCPFPPGMPLQGLSSSYGTRA